MDVKCTCGRVLNVRPEDVGRVGKCRNCGKALRLVPGAEPAQHRSASASANPTPSQPERRVAAKRWVVAAFAAVVVWFYFANRTPSSASARQDGADSIAPLVIAHGTVPSLTPLDGAAPAPAEDAAPPANEFAALLPSRTPEPPCEPDASRPASGDELFPGSTGGRSSLKVTNGTVRDAVVSLIDRSGGVARRVYVRHGDWVEVVSIPRGFYTLRFALGAEYSSERGFCESPSASEFDRTLDFREIEYDDRVRFSENEITLHPVAHGNAPAHPIDPRLVFAAARPKSR